MTRRASNYRTEQQGLALLHHVAPAVADALTHLRRELVVFDGWASRGDSPGRGSSSSTIPEAAVLARLALTNAIDDVDDAIWGVEIAVKHLAKLAADALGKRLPMSIDQPRCRDGQYDRNPGAWSDDPQCPVLPDKNGLCTRHYSAWRRFKIAEDDDDRASDYEPAVSA